MICDKCKHTIDEKALVHFFLEHPKWSFWGEQGERFKICSTSEFIHFRVVVDGQSRHRMALISSW